MKSTERFSNRVENYIKYRPHYPKEIIPFLQKKAGLSPETVVADIGSGTGISAELFLQNGNRVYGVEPNEGMRKAAEQSYKGNKKFISINATAESTTLPNGSIDLIVSGQAFHWFDRAKTKREFQRIAAPGASVVLMWNDRDLKSSFQQAYEKLLREFGTDYDKVSMRALDEAALKDFFAPLPCNTHSFSHSQSLDFEGLKGRLLSSSFVPLESDARYKPMLHRLEELFKEFSKNSKVDFEYHCNLYYGKLD